MDFSFNLKTKLYFGENIVQKALEQEKELLGKTIYIVSTGRSLEKQGYLSDLICKLEKIVPDATIIKWTNISANPDISEIEAAINHACDYKIDSVIGFGGGSAIDAAKAVGIGLRSEKSIKDIFEEGKEVKDIESTVFAIPTTAGTGSELSKAAIISNRGTRTKNGIRGDSLIAKVAIVDPIYTYTVPQSVTAETGFDVLAHAIESYVSVKSNYFSEMLSEEAIRIVGKYLPRLSKDINDKEARAKLSYASLLMGLNLKNVGTGLPHRMQYPLGALSESSHGAGLISLYPSWIKNEYDVSKEKIKKVMLELGYMNTNSNSEAEANMKDFITRIYHQVSIRDLGISIVTAKELADMVTGNIKNDPLGELDEIIEKIYKEALEK